MKILIFLCRILSLRNPAKGINLNNQFPDSKPLYLPIIKKIKKKKKKKIKSLSEEFKKRIFEEKW